MAHLSWLLVACATAAEPCAEPGSFTQLSFRTDNVVRSNIGGSARSCMDARPDCRPELYIANVGTAPSGQTIALRVTNESEYAAPATQTSGVLGGVGALRLRSPAPTAVVLTQFKFEFIEQATGERAEPREGHAAGVAGWRGG